MKIIRARPAVLLPFLVLCACGGGGGGGDDGGSTPPPSNVSFDATAMIDNLADSVIVAGYARLDEAADELGAAVAALADGTATEDELDAAQAAWKACRVPWESSEGHLFGPVDARGIDPAIDTWPLATVELQQFLASGNTSPDDIRNASENVQGFHAIEYLLFGDGTSTNDQSVTELDADELDYLVSLTTVLRGHTHDLVTGWTEQYDPDDADSGPYADQVKNPGASSVYASQAAVVEELVNGVINIVDEVANGKITEPLGADIDSADTSLVESQYSWNSLTDFHHNIQSVVNLYTGVRDFNPLDSEPSAGANGLYAFVAAHDEDLANQVYDQLITAYDAIALIDGDDDPTTTDITGPDQIPFRQAISDQDGRVRAQAAIDALNGLRDTLTTEVVPLIDETDFSE